MPKRMVFIAGLASVLVGVLLPGTLSWAAGRPSGGARADAYIVEGDNSVQRLDGLTGAVIWRFPIPGSIAGAQQTFVAGRLFFLLTQHDVIALDRRLGRERWRIRVPSPDLIEDAAAGPVGIYVRESMDQGLRQEIQAIDSRGVTRWTSPVPVSGDHFVVLDGAVYVSDHVRRQAGTGLLALDAVTGNERWRASVTPAPVPATLTLAGGILYARSDRDVRYPDHLVALDERTGAVRWEQPSADARLQWGDVRVDGDLVSVNATPMDGPPVPPEQIAIGAFAARTGTPVWRAPAHQFVPGIPTVDGRLISRHLLAQAEMIEGLDRRTGLARWAASTCAAVSCLVGWAGSDGARISLLQYVAAGTIDLVGLDARSGKVVLQQRLDRTAPPPFGFWARQGGDTVYLQMFGLPAAGGGQTPEFLQAVELRTGRELWAHQYLPTTGSTVVPPPVIA